MEPLRSGIYTIPLVLSLVVASMVSGFTTQKIGYYAPAMFIAPSVMTVGLGLMSTFTPSAGSNRWIGYQFIAGFGLGFGLQTASLAAQTVLGPDDVSMGISIIFFMQQLGGAVFTSVGQAILSNLLVAKLSGVPGLSPMAVANSGATELPSIVPPQYLGVVINAYNYACTRIFLAAMGIALCALLAAGGVEWKSIKKGKPGHDHPKDAGEAEKGEKAEGGTGVPDPAVPEPQQAGNAR